MSFDADVATVGETMVSLRSSGPLQLPGTLQASSAGAESTVAIGLARLGHRARWVSRVSTDPYGQLIVRIMRGEGVDVNGVVRDQDHPTGLMVLARRSTELSQVNYWRAGSAASFLGPQDLDGLGNPRILHLTGITPALSASAAQACLVAARRVHAAGGMVCLDVNHRVRLWSRDQASSGLREIVALADIVIASDDELDLVAPGDQDQAVATLLSGQPHLVVIKRGAAGASAWTTNGRVDAPAYRVQAIDTVGAGDCFCAGLLSGLLDDLGMDACLDRGNRLGAFSVGVQGDWEGLPTRADLDLLTRPAGTALR